MKKIMAIILAVVLLTATLTGCAKRSTIIFGLLDRHPVEIEGFENFDKATGFTENYNYPQNFEMKNYASLTALLLGLKGGNIDYIGLPKSVADYVVKNETGLTSIPGRLSNNFHMGTLPEQKPLRDSVDAAISELKSTGELDRLIEQYVTDEAPRPNKIIGDRAGVTYAVGVTGDLPPFDYVGTDGIPAGFNVALLNAIGQVMGCNFKMVQIEAAARTTALATGRIDIVFWVHCFGDSGVADSNKDIAITQSYYSAVEAIVTKDYPAEKIKETLGLE